MTSLEYVHNNIMYVSGVGCMGIRTDLPMIWEISIEDKLILKNVI